MNQRKKDREAILVSRVLIRCLLARLGGMATIPLEEFDAQQQTELLVLENKEKTALNLQVMVRTPVDPVAGKG
jgi:hypothetical protein